MTPLSQQIAIVAAMLLQPWRSDDERRAARSKLQWIASGVQALEAEASQAKCALDQIAENAREEAETAEASSRVVRLRPVLALVESRE